MKITKLLSTFLFATFLMVGCVTTGSTTGISYNESVNTVEKVTPANPKLKEYKKIAVLFHFNKPSYRPDTTTSRLIEDNIIEMAINKGYRVPSRSDLARVMKEINLQNSGLTPASDAARFGRILNVPAVFIVHIAKLDRSRSGRSYRNFITLSGRVIDTETTEIIWIKSISGSANEQDASISDVIAGLASKLAGYL